MIVSVLVIGDGVVMGTVNVEFGYGVGLVDITDVVVGGRGGKLVLKGVVYTLVVGQPYLQVVTVIVEVVDKVE